MSGYLVLILGLRTIQENPFVLANYSNGRTLPISKLSLTQTLLLHILKYKSENFTLLSLHQYLRLELNIFFYLFRSLNLQRSELNRAKFLTKLSPSYIFLALFAAHILSLSHTFNRILTNQNHKREHHYLH